MTKLLLPLLNVDTMAALLTTCKEANQAFQVVPVESKFCRNFGLAKRLGHNPYRFRTKEWDYFIDKFDRQFLIIDWLDANLADVQARIENAWQRVLKERRHGLYHREADGSYHPLDRKQTLIKLIYYNERTFTFRGETEHGLVFYLESFNIAQKIFAFASIAGETVFRRGAN